ncbi:MAG: cbb3-type cytochrome c oxidase subunit 3 [Deltaproteobacteria bacterium]|nr:cbb3-type cytochrome c oxidase subunit 3 [Deltaproteobacteria bacterium]
MRDLLTKIDPSSWSQYSAVGFLIGFTLLVCWVYWPARKSTYEALAQLPVEKE